MPAPYRLRKAPKTNPGPVTQLAGSVVQAYNLSPALCESFKYVPSTNNTITPGVDHGGTHTDSGPITFDQVVYDKQGAWSVTDWIVINGSTYRVHVRVKLVGDPGKYATVQPGTVFQLSLLGTQAGTTQALASGPWCPTVTDDQGNDQADVTLDETLPIPAGMDVQVHIKATTTSVVEVNAPSTYSAAGAIPAGPYLAGSFIEVTEVFNA